MSLFGLFRPPNVEELEAKRDVQGLIKSLSYQKRDNVRQAAAEALGKIGVPAVEPLIAALKDRNMQKATTEALRKIGTPAVEPLIAALRNQEIDVCKAAAEVLGKIGDARAVEPLIVAFKGRSWQVQEAAAAALKDIGGPEAERVLEEREEKRRRAEAEEREERRRRAKETEGTATATSASRQDKHIQGILVLTRRPLNNSRSLLQQIVDQQRSGGHSFASNFVATCRVGDVNDNAYIYATVRSEFSAFGGHDLMERTRMFPFQAPDGNDGNYFIVFDRP